MSGCSPPGYATSACSVGAICHPPEVTNPARRGERQYGRDRGPARDETGRALSPLSRMAPVTAVDRRRDRPDLRGPRAHRAVRRDGGATGTVRYRSLSHAAVDRRQPWGRHVWARPMSMPKSPCAGNRALPAAKTCPQRREEEGETGESDALWRIADRNEGSTGHHHRARTNRPYRAGRRARISVNDSPRRRRASARKELALA